MSVKPTIHSVGTGRDSLTGKEADGLTVSFENGKQRFLSWRSFRQLVTMELAEANGKPEEASLFPPEAVPVK